MPRWAKTGKGRLPTGLAERPLQWKGHPSSYSAHASPAILFDRGMRASGNKACPCRIELQRVWDVCLSVSRPFSEAFLVVAAQWLNQGLGRNRNPLSLGYCSAIGDHCSAIGMPPAFGPTRRTSSPLDRRRKQNLRSCGFILEMSAPHSTEQVTRQCKCGQTLGH